MGHLSVYTSHRVNGVSAVHSDLVRDELFSDFAQRWPDRFCNVTNGITPRHWLARAMIADLEREFNSFRTLGITTAVLGGLAFGGGIAMLAVGKQQRDAARYRGMALAPYGSRRGAGLPSRAERPSGANPSGP